ncbi:two-component regulator propeller domain-containing protein [Candidatus Halobeggiatoa sp. HSG11]|nr:two-component regulator propeller domain-containing protein [Candidatus Halobeggiatoa sp. HSG11]
MKKSLKLILLSILISIVISAQADPSKSSDTLYFDKIKTSTLINMFMQDSDGFFWIGGNNGLHKYDGYTFKHYTAGPDSVAGNDVGAIYEDSQGLIWIGSASGLSVYDKNNDTFTTYLHDPNDPTSISNNQITSTTNRPQAIVEDADNMVWIATGNGLNKFDRTNQTFIRYQGLFISDDIWNIYLDSKQFLWVGSVNGLHKFDPRSGTVLERYEMDNNNPDSLHGNYINAIFEDKEGTLWIGTRSGINHLVEGQFTHYSYDPNNKNSLTNDTVASIMEDLNGILWITTIGGGFSLFDKNTEVFTNYRHEPNNPNSIDANYITTVYQDELGIIWFSSYSGVLHRVDPEAIKFQSYVHDPENSNSLSKNSYVAHGIEDEEGMIWIAIGEGGLDRYDRKTKTFTHYDHNPDDPNSLPEPYGQSIVEDDIGNLWVSTGVWIFRFDKKAEKVKQTYPALNWPSGPVKDNTNSDLIWWGTWGTGLLKFSKSNGETTYFTPSLDNPNETVSSTEIPYLYQDKAGMIWVCTRGGGLDKFDPRTEKVVAKYKHIPTDLDTVSSNLIYQVYQDSAGRYWVTTDKGFNQFDPKTEKFTRLNPQNSLFPLNSTSQIIEDEQGYLWIAGLNIGKLVQFNPQNGDYKVYTTDDGILPGISSSYAAMRSLDGTLWFFGRGGVNSFHPQQIKDSLYQPSVFLTSLTQSGEPIKTGKAPERVTEIQLDWQHNFFEFEAAALNYRHAKYNQYRYKLEGVDYDWFEAGKIRHGRYTGLLAGEYTLKIQGSNNDGLWSNKIAELKVVVIPPWWNTTWFKSIMLILIMTAFFIGYRWRIKIIQQRNLELEKQVTKRTSELQESQRAMRTLVSNLPGMAYRCRNDSNWTMEFISDACLVLTGYEITAIINNAEISYADIIHHNDQESVWQFVQQALQNKQPFELTYRIITKTGQLKWVWEQGQGVFDKNGKLLALEGLVSDITEQKQTEIALQNSEKRLRKMIEKSPLPMVITDANQDIEYFNDKFTELFGYTLKDVSTAEQWWQIAYPDENYRKLVQQSWMSAIEYAMAHNKDIETQVWDLTIKNRTKRRCEFYMVPLDQNSLIIMTDITEKVKIQTELKQAKEKAEIANQIKSTFLASMSHELRTPLNGILGFAQILQYDSSITSKQQHGLNVIEQSGNHLLSLINDILDLAKIESGKIELYESGFNLSSLLIGVGEIIKIRAKDKNINFYLESMDKLPNWLYGDERRLRQILLNLLGNAVKFTDEGSVTLQVKSEKVKDKSEKIKFLIQDTGIGISPKNLETIFKPFEQVGEQEQQMKGTGLGLAISKNLVELMAGKLYVSSQVNVGTQFWFEITLTSFSPKHAVSKSDYNFTRQLIIGIKDKSPKLLLVDDNLENLNVLVNLLSPLGFNTQTAHNGQEGLEKAIEWQPDAIITDLIMPEMDGFELICQLRQSPELKEKIIIVSSASVYDTDRERSLTIGSNAFLPKPIQIEKLLEQLQQHLDLTWVYEDVVKESSEENHAAPMIFPSIAELEKLYELSLMGYVNELEEQVAILANFVELKPFVTQMQVFLKNYQIKKLLKWLEEIMKNDS